MTSRTEIPATGTGESVFARPHRALTCGVILSVGLVAFESLGIATVLPEIAGALGGLDSYGWGLSTLMLANIVGTVAAGRSADRTGVRRPLLLGLVVFTMGCLLAGAAGNWPLFLAGRAAQGLGVGAIMGMAYTVVGLAYPERLRARMFALLSSAWTVPSLVGPTLAAWIADVADWRGVFLLMLPLTAAATVLVLPAIRRFGRPNAPDAAQDGPWWQGPVAASCALTAATAVLLWALSLRSLLLLVVLALAGLAVALAALRRITPPGTLSLRPGVGAGIVVRGLLCGVYFGSEAFIPLGLTELRHLSPTQAGLGLSAGALAWVAGSALQARQDARTAEDGRGRGRVQGVALGCAVLLAGVLITALAMLLPAVPALLAVVGWAVGGLGMGVAFNAATTDTMEQAASGQEGAVSAGLQLAQTLSTAVISGAGGAVIAIAHAHGSTTRAALLCVFAVTGVLATLGVLASRRLRPRTA
ncbi:MFS transporter [Streptomyces sp. NBS 14/10]|uniref:MFS transporter n=1 Tax=Streptomyces sp. NBS 14/10 TaxID=1945643 RepID=UPI00211ACAEB|nr:MFS transporter [Streptomyces sp. NBS 14/10]KAK1183555.1 MFS transporter [Streptomyces sp. NBS 14/10]